MDQALLEHNQRLLIDLNSAAGMLASAESILKDSFGPLHPIRAQLDEYIKGITKAVNEVDR